MGVLWCVCVCACACMCVCVCACVCVRVGGLPWPGPARPCTDAARPRDASGALGLPRPNLCRL